MKKLIISAILLIGCNVMLLGQASFDIDTGKLVNDLNANGFSINGANAVNGKTGGMTITGDTASGGSLTLQSTTNATKGKIYFGIAHTSYYDGSTNTMTISSASSGSSTTYDLIVRNTAGTGAVRLQIDAAGSGSYNSGIELAENGVKKWTIATYSGGRFTFFNENVLAEAIGIDTTTNLVTFGASATVNGVLKLGTTPVTVSNAAGNILASSLSGTVAVANGGTNLSSYTIGDILYASGSTTLSKLADVAAGSFLRSGGTSTAPAWSTTTWPNSATTGDLLYASGSNAYANLAGVAAGSFLRSGGTSTAPAWSTTTWPNSATLGDLNYASASNVFSTLAGNTTTTKKWLNQTGNGSVSAAPAWSIISDSDISFTDITTGNASTTQHGYLKKLSGTGTQYMDGNGNWSTPTGSGSGVGWDSTFNVSGSDATTTSTTAVDVTGLSYSASANHTYEIEAVLRTNSSTTAGMSVGINYSAAGATLNAEATSVGTGTGAVTALATLGTPVLANTANNVDGVALIRGYVVTGANAGNITVIFSKTTSGTATVRLASLLKIKQIL